jgi:hypothetical protein
LKFRRGFLKNYFLVALFTQRSFVSKQKQARNSLKIGDFCRELLQSRDDNLRHLILTFVLAQPLSDRGRRLAGAAVKKNFLTNLIAKFVFAGEVD